MRTTVTLDADVVALLRAAMRRKAISFKQALNLAVRTALGSGSRNGKPTRFRLKTFKMGPPHVPLDQALALAAAMEDEESAREMHVRK